MSARVMELRALPGRLAVCRLPADARIPAWALAGTFVSVTRTAAAGRAFP
ncbi:MAG TPA: hypothetical protein VJR48_03245 [Ktedonobacterales bacterium]|nr:hypothetical protein [Ktedonobacterales bacterium]